MNPVSFASENAQTQALESRISNPLAEAVDAAGIMTAGVDFPAGTYDIQPTGDLTGLREGMYVRLNLETEHIDDALTVPEAAIKTYLNNDVVYIADNGTARRQIVTVGSSNGEDTVITSGLNEGDMVITAGNVTDGTSISVVESQEN